MVIWSSFEGDSESPSWPFSRYLSVEFTTPLLDLVRMRITGTAERWRWESPLSHSYVILWSQLSSALRMGNTASNKAPDAASGAYSPTPREETVYGEYFHPPPSSRYSSSGTYAGPSSLGTTSSSVTPPVPPRATGLERRSMTVVAREKPSDSPVRTSYAYSFRYVQIMCVILFGPQNLQVHVERHTPLPPHPSPTHMHAHTCMHTHTCTHMHTHTLTHSQLPNMQTVVGNVRHLWFIKCRHGLLLWGTFQLAFIFHISIIICSHITHTCTPYTLSLIPLLHTCTHTHTPVSEHMLVFVVYRPVMSPPVHPPPLLTNQ